MRGRRWFGMGCTVHAGVTVSLCRLHADLCRGLCNSPRVSSICSWRLVRSLGLKRNCFHSPAAEAAPFISALPVTDGLSKSGLCSPRFLPLLWVPVPKQSHFLQGWL